MPSFQATTRKSPLPEGETAFYLQRLANGALCHGEVCCGAPVAEKEQIYPWNNCLVSLLRSQSGQNCLLLAIFVEHGSLRKHQLTEDSREEDQF